MLFDFLEMANNYEQRKVARYEKGNVMVDTAMVSDAEQPYETAVAHPQYNEGNMVIVELYDTKEEAEKGHKKWVKIITNKKLPNELKDVSSSKISKVSDKIGGKDWRIKKRKQ